MSLKRWRDKVERYAEYANSGRYEERFGMKHFRVLVVTTTPKRLANLTTAMDGKSGPNFWTAVVSDVTAKGVLGEVWRRAGGEAAQALLSETVVRPAIP